MSNLDGEYFLKIFKKCYFEMKFKLNKPISGENTLYEVSVFLNFFQNIFISVKIIFEVNVAN
jgi:hypothetical protein